MNNNYEITNIKQVGRVPDDAHFLVTFHEQRMGLYDEHGKFLAGEATLPKKIDSVKLKALIK